MGYEEIRDKNALLTKYMNDCATLMHILDSLNDLIINFTPDIEGAWSIKEHIGHLVDTEVNGYVRFHRAILNPGTTIDLGGGDMERSNEKLDYAHRNYNDMISLFRLIRKVIYEHAFRMKDDDFDKYYIEHANHPVFRKCSLGFILSINTQHFDKHMEFIKRNVALYAQSTRAI